MIALGAPAHVWEMKKPDVIPADGSNLYRFVQLAGPLSEDIDVSAIQFGGNLNVLHHAHLFALPKPASEYRGFEDKVTIHPGEVEVAIQPYFKVIGIGNIVMPFKKTSIRLPKGSYPMLELHYQPSGKKELNREKLTIYSRRVGEKPELKLMGFPPVPLDIPAHAKNWKVWERITTDKDMTVFGINIHTHARGKSYRLTAFSPLEPKKVLCRAAKFDLTAMTRFQDGVFIPKGTTLVAEFTYDNSSQNPVNPDPTKNVYTGYFRQNEMAVSDLFYVDGRQTGASK
jgi:hypothetical protein